jgi:PAS domain S-box-containing protein
MLKVLFVEDAPTDVDLAIRQLHKSGFDIESKRVETGAELVQALDQFQPNIVLCDNGLPGFDAASAIRVIRHRSADVPIIVVTGTLEDEAAVELVRAGANDYVCKDHLVRLPVAVSLALEGARYRRDQNERDAALLVSELHHRRRFETAADGIVVAHAETCRIHDVNPSLVGLLGYAREEYLGRSLREFDFLRLPDGKDLPIRKMGETGDSYRCAALTVRTKDGRAVDVELVAVVYRVGQEMTIQCNLRDVTERQYFQAKLREKNRELEAANQAKDNFLASMSHEFRTPLNGIIGFTGTLLMRLPGDLTGEQERQLRIVQASANHLLSLINDLLNLAKIESGKLELDREVVSCSRILRDVVASMGSMAAAKGLMLTIDMPSEDVVLTTSQRAVWQIVTNLTANAIKFTPAGGVSLTLRQLAAGDEARIEIAVSDTGVGIGPEDRARLFLPFSQVDMPLTRREEGTGLGLYISRKLALLIGGEITVESECRHGATFTLSIPDGTGQCTRPFS